MRPRTKIHQCLIRVRHYYRKAIEKFYEKENMIEVELPVLTNNYCESDEKMFHIKGGEKLFGSQVGLTVSRQLLLESYVPMGKVYTRGSCFRAENSQISKHLYEFNMIEAEMLNYNLTNLISCCERFVKFIIEYVFGHCYRDLLYISDFNNDTTLIKKLQYILLSKFKRISYTEAINLIQNEQNELPKIKWGDNLDSVHSKWIISHFECPVVIHSYPTETKSFHIKFNNDSKTMQKCNIFVPGIGKLISGSVKENDLNTLVKKIYINIVGEKYPGSINLDNELKNPYKFIKMANKRMNQKKYCKIEKRFFKFVSEFGWYFKLRLFGGQKSAGYGMESERMLMLLTGMKDIRDVVTFHQ
jgi:asparaginyl-tRNA synthetase